LISRDFPAMGTTISVTAADEADISATQRWFDHAEGVCSRFLAHSELSRLNNDPRTELAVPAPLAPVLATAAEVRELTGGLVDVGVGADVIRWGYDRTFAMVGDQDVAPPSGDPARAWEIHAGRLSRTPGLRIDLGGIAKGWAADRAIEWGLARIVSAGGDIASAHPECSVEVGGPDGDTVATIPLGVGALATSSVTQRRWRVAGDEAHHLIDPRSGMPAHSPILSATVVARSAVAAEAGAKTVLIRGADGLVWASRQPWIDGAMVVWRDGSVYATSGLEVAA
jgi:thiamine biosynthesis lipoprotein